MKFSGIAKTLFLSAIVLGIGAPAFSFDFSKDVASHFFWTESYKKAHPVPTNNMPKSMTEYYRRAKEAAQAEKNIPNPKFTQDEKLVETPGPDIVFKKYNNPAGKNELNLNDLVKSHKVNSIGVVSPMKDELVYSTVYYYPETRTAGSELYLIPLDMSKTLQNRVESAHVNQGQKAVFKTGMDALNLDIYKTLTVVDWSSDAKKIALKEKISNTADGLWKTNLLVFDVETKTMRDLTEIREAVKYYWKKQAGLDLSDYRWDIFPVGWDALNPDRIIVFAYAFTTSTPKYLGAWSIDYNGNRSMLMSLTNTEFEVSQNGICLKAVYNDNK